MNQGVPPQALQVLVPSPPLFSPRLHMQVAAKVREQKENGTWVDEYEQTQPEVP